MSQPDIVDAIAAFRNAFLANNLQPPTVVYFSCVNDGIAFLKVLHGDAGGEMRIAMARFVAPDGTEYAQMNVLGMAFRTPVR